jgi:hypothetical protein
MGSFTCHRPIARQWRALLPDPLISDEGLGPAIVCLRML